MQAQGLSHTHTQWTYTMLPYRPAQAYTGKSSHDEGCLGTQDESQVVVQQLDFQLWWLIYSFWGGISPVLQEVIELIPRCLSLVHLQAWSHFK